jgi:UDP-N-acetylmuramoylalanine--D-glutamate ligase
MGAALGIIEYLSLDQERARQRLCTFTALPYRLTLSRELDGVVYLNDSKATNVHAACTGVSSLSGRLIVIAGGYDKGLDLSEFITLLRDKAHVVLTIGQTGPHIVEALAMYDTECIGCGTLDIAIEEAHRRSSPGDLVVFSPAASSFDQFKSYEARGATFDLLVSQLVSKLQDPS